MVVIINIGNVVIIIIIIIIIVIINFMAGFWAMALELDLAWARA